MSKPTWDTLGGRGLSVDGEVVISVVWWGPAPRLIDRIGELVQGPDGYYFQGGNIVHTQLLEEADEPTDAGWERMHQRALKAYQEWIAAQAAPLN